jgi:hypothetical protein
LRAGEPLDAFVVDDDPLASQPDVQASIAEAGPLGRQLAQPGSQHCVVIPAPTAIGDA